MTRLASLFAFALGLGALALLAARSGPVRFGAPVASPGLADAPPLTTAGLASMSPLSASGVFHVNDRHVWIEPGGEQTEVRENEFWFDPDTQDARYDQRSLTSDFDQVSIRRGRTYLTYIPRDDQLASWTVLEDGHRVLQLVRRYVLSYRDDLESGQLKPIGEGLVEGKPALVVEQRVESEGRIDTIRTYVDKENGLPLRNVAYSTRPTGEREELQREIITYPLVERVARSSLPADLFDAPQAQTASNQMYMTVKSARAFGEYGLYWAGPAYATLPLADIFRDKKVERGTVEDSSVTLVYAPMANGKRIGGRDVQLVERAATPDIIRERRRCAEPQRGEEVTVGGRQVLLCDNGREGADLYVTIDGTFIHILANSRQEALLVGELLQKLN